MKGPASIAVWLPVAFVLGGLVGYYGPSEELRTRELRAAEERAKPKPKATGFGSFAEMVKIPDTARHPRRRRDEPKAAGGETNATASAESSQPKGSGRPRPPRLAPEDLRARIDEAADLWRARAEIAKASAVQKLGLDDGGAESFEAAVTAMNDKLRESIQIVADELAAAEEMTPELGVRLMGDLSSSVAEAYDAVAACVGEGRRGDVSKLQMIDFVDPSVAEPLIAVQGKLEAFR